MSEKNKEDGGDDTSRDGGVLVRTREGRKNVGERKEILCVCVDGEKEHVISRCDAPRSYLPLCMEMEMRGDMCVGC